MSSMLASRPPLVSVCITVLVNSKPSTSTDIRISIFVLIFVLSVRIKQVILFVWINVLNCNNDVNIKACVATSTF